MIRRIAALAILCLPPAAHGERWEMQYFHDVDNENLVLRDIAFPSARRGVAAGSLYQKNRERPVVLVTADAGRQWSMVRVKETPLSLFFLDETAGWMVTRGGVWFTDEGGRTWRKILKSRDLLKVRFVDLNRGYAIGRNRTVLETVDGGKKWTQLPAAAEAKTTREYTVFESIDFAGRAGIIAGWVRRPGRRESLLPLWMDPESTRRRERPRLSVFIQTNDNGANWIVQKSSLFGRITAVELGSDGRGMALVQFQDRFEYPAEIHCIDLSTSKSESCFRQKQSAITDIALVTDGPAYAAGFEPAGTIAYSPVPGKLKVLRGESGKWNQMEVDYRAVATQVHIAAAGAKDVWLATDTGMILKLVP